MQDIEKVREFFKNDHFACQMGIKIDSIGDDFAICSLEVNKSHFNAGDTVQGGVIFTLADFAFAVAANITGFLTVSLSNSITYIQPPKGTSLIAHASKVSSTKRTCLYSVLIKDEFETIIAAMNVNGFIKETKINF